MFNVVYERNVRRVPPANTYIYCKDLVYEGGYHARFFRGDSSMASMALCVVRRPMLQGKQRGHPPHARVVSSNPTSSKHYFFVENAISLQFAFENE